MSTEKQETKGKWEILHHGATSQHGPYRSFISNGEEKVELVHYNKVSAQQIIDALNAKSEWIRVEERAFDDMGKIVLFIGRNVRNPMVGYFTNHADGPEFFDAKGYELDCEITHYMRLPEPPNDGGGK